MKNPTISTMKNYFGALLLMLMCFGFMQKQVYAVVLGVDPGSDTLQAFNEATWTAASPPVRMTMTGFTVLGAQAITWNSDNLLYYVIVTVDPDPPGVPFLRYLATVDPATGVLSPIGVLSSTAFSSLTYNSDLGILYAMIGSGGGPALASTLYSVNILTAATTLLGGPYPIGADGEVIAYNYDNDLIYHWSGFLSGAANLETINPVTFLATPLLQTGALHREVTGAVYRGGGVFSLTDVGTAQATNGYNMTTAGVVTLVGPIPFRVRGLGFADPVLPVELSSFVSSISGNDVSLNWSTSSEINNSGFEIERLNGQWTKVGFVNGNGTTTSSKNYSFTDRNLNSGTYSYRLKQIDFNGNFEYFNLSNEVVIGVPANFELAQNYPNPFNPSTKIDFQLPKDGNVNISVYDNSGKDVMTIVNEFKTAGYYSVNLNAASLSSGIYFYKITSDNFSSVKKMMLVK